MRRLPLSFAVTAAFLLALAPSASGQVIIAPTSGVINSGGPGFGTLTETFNQSGLSVGYTSGVTNFATYIGSGPTHTTTFAGFEWFSNSGTTSASVTYNLGSVWFISALALWNEESAGIGLLDLFWSLNGTDFFALSTGLVPTDNPLADYGADVFGFGPTAAQYVRFDMSRCPQQNPGTFQSCAIGEVAFAASASVVPEPATMTLLATGLVGIAARRRRQRA